jgi:hypothetical protein
MKYALADINADSRLFVRKAKGPPASPPLGGAPHPTPPTTPTREGTTSLALTLTLALALTPMGSTIRRRNQRQQQHQQHQQHRAPTTATTTHNTTRGTPWDLGPLGS